MKREVFEDEIKRIIKTNHTEKTTNNSLICEECNWFIVSILTQNVVRIDWFIDNTRKDTLQFFWCLREVILLNNKWEDNDKYFIYQQWKMVEDKSERAEITKRQKNIDNLLISLNKVL